jgi:inhibitor of KinA
MITRYQSFTPFFGEFSWDQPISDELLQFQIALAKQFKIDFGKDIQEVRMGFKTLSVLWKKEIPSMEITSWIECMADQLTLITWEQKVWEVPVCYSESKGKDLKILAARKNMSKEELISLHSNPSYRIYFFGFLPGFMYLNGLHEVLHTPRKSVPELIVPAGSVAIGANQTGIYPSQSPGGWHLIGTSPLVFFDPKSKPPVWASPGELIVFRPITEKEFDFDMRHPQIPKLK